MNKEEIVQKAQELLRQLDKYIINKLEQEVILKVNDRAINFGGRLKAIRKKQKLSQTQLSKKLNIPLKTIGNYERNIHRPSYERLVEIADCLETTVDNLLGHKIGMCREEAILLTAMDCLSQKNFKDWGYNSGR